jgi:hypothetical protein
MYNLDILKFIDTVNPICKISKTSPWIRALGGVDWWKNRGSKMSCNCPLKYWYAKCSKILSFCVVSSMRASCRVCWPVSAQQSSVSVLYPQWPSSPWHWRAEPDLVPDHPVGLKSMINIAPSVADQGCFIQIRIRNIFSPPDPDPNFFSSRIPIQTFLTPDPNIFHPGSRILRKRRDENKTSFFHAIYSLMLPGASLIVLTDIRTTE